MSSDKNEKKMYLAIGFVMVIIIIAWILNIKNSFSDNSKNYELDKQALDQKWNQMTSDLSEIIGNIDDIKDSLSQSATTSLTNLQNAATITPDQLISILDKIKISTTTTSTNKIID